MMQQTLAHSLAHSLGLSFGHVKAASKDDGGGWIWSPLRISAANHVHRGASKDDDGGWIWSPLRIKG